MLKIDELGEAPVLGENLEQDGATDDELANIKIEDESKASIVSKQRWTLELTVNSDFNVI